jgi:hypothetical protein
MSTNNIELLKQKITEIDNHIGDMLNSNYMSDKAYTKITAIIGHIDDLHGRDKADDHSHDYHAWVKNRLHKICDILVNIKKLSGLHQKNEPEDLMHPTGDYYNEDNSIILTPEVKMTLSNILKEKFQD